MRFIDKFRNYICFYRKKFREDDEFSDLDGEDDVAKLMRKIKKRQRIGLEDEDFEEKEVLKEQSE